MSALRRSCFKKNLLFRYKPLDLGLELLVKDSSVLKKAFRLFDLSEPWGQPVRTERWEKFSKKNCIGMVWGMFKLSSPLFVDFCRRNEIPLVYVERSPLIKNNRLALYFDTGGTTNFSNYFGKENWNMLCKRQLSAARKNQLEEYRREVIGRSAGVDLQKAKFKGLRAIKEELGISLDKKIVFCPMQVDHDVTITQDASSPWISNMAHFLSVIDESLDALPENYHLIVKEHPRNVMEGNLTEFRLNRDRITFVREEVNANALCQGCNAMLTINSGMGTEAMVFHKPVISLGKSFYSDKGINYEARNEEELRDLLSRIDELSPPKELMDIYIYHFVFDFSYDLTTEEDTVRLVKYIKDFWEESKKR